MMKKATAQSRRVSWSTLFYGLAAFGSAAARQFIEGLLNETDFF